MSAPLEKPPQKIGEVSTTALSIPTDDPLLVSIRKEVESANKRVRETVTNFRKIGELLIELKKRIPHGKFMDEVENLTGIPHRSASRYMAMVNQKPSRAGLKDAPAETYLRKCMDVSIVDRDSQNGQVANLNPSTASPPRVAGTEIIDVEEAIETELDPLVVDESGHGPAAPVHVSHNSGNNEWYTPPTFIESARRVMGSIDLDPASCEIANKTVMATSFYSQAEDGLKQAWRGRVWMNPPYAQPLIGLFAEKLAQSYQGGVITQAIALVNNATETEWFHKIAERSSAICFPKSRIKFLDPDGNPGGPLQGQAFLYLGDDPMGFAREFKQYGLTVFINREQSIQ